MQNLDGYAKFQIMFRLLHFAYMLTLYAGYSKNGDNIPEIVLKRNWQDA